MESNIWGSYANMAHWSEKKKNLEYTSHGYFVTKSRFQKYNDFYGLAAPNIDYLLLSIDLWIKVKKESNSY